MFKKTKLKIWMAGAQAGSTNALVAVIQGMRNAIEKCSDKKCESCKTRLTIIRRISKDYGLSGY